MTILSPFLISIVLAYLFTPLVNYFHARGYKKGIIVAVLATIGLLLVVDISFLIVPKIMAEISDIRDRLPELAKQIKLYLERLQIQVERIYPPLKGKYLPEIVMQQINSFFETLPAQIPAIIGNLFNLLSLFVLIPFITVALLIDSDRLADWIFSMFPSSYAETILSIISEINQVMRDFIQGQTMRLLWITILTTGGLLALGVDFAFLFGVLSGIFNIIPVLGAWLAAVPPLLIVLLRGDMPLLANVAVFFILLQVVDNTFLSTYYMSKAVNLHFVLVLFSLLIGAELYGLMGVILSVPVVSMIKVVISILYHNYKNKKELELRQEIYSAQHGE